MIETIPFGAWPSPIGSADLVQGALRLSAPRIHRGVLYWLEGRPSEGGRQVLMAASLPADARGPFAEAREVTPATANVRTRVHEYGGGEFAIGSTRAYYVDDEEGRIFSCSLTDGGAIALSRDASRFADLVLSPDEAWLVAVEECERAGEEPENRLVAFALDRAATGEPSRARAPSVIASGHDFYASPTFKRRGARRGREAIDADRPASSAGSNREGELAFLAWDHPNMPWNGTWLQTIAWGPDGKRGEPQTRGGGERISIFQPRYAPDGAAPCRVGRVGLVESLAILAGPTAAGPSDVSRTRAPAVGLRNVELGLRRRARRDRQRDGERL